MKNKLAYIYSIALFINIVCANNQLTLDEICLKLNIKPSQLAILWCLKNQNVSTVILGASKLSQLKENLDSINYFNLITDDIIVEINNC